MSNFNILYWFIWFEYFNFKSKFNVYSMKFIFEIFIYIIITFEISGFLTIIKKVFIFNIIL